MLLKIRIKPESKKQLIMEITSSSYSIHVKSPKERGEANKEMLEILKEYFKTNNIKIIKGHTTPHKIVDVFTLV